MPSSLEIPSLGNTFGVLLISIFISLIMFGLTLAQTIRYARLYSSDRPFLKILVAAILYVLPMIVVGVHIDSGCPPLNWFSAADMLHSASMMHICYYYLVTNYFNPKALSMNVWSLDLLPLSTVLHSKDIYRYKYRRIVVFIIFLLFVELGFMISSSVVSFRTRTFDGMHRYIWMDTVLFGAATLVDLVLTGAFVTIMNRSRTGILGADSALDILSRYALYATGLISALTVPAFISSLVLSRTFVYFAIAIPAVKVYSNSVLAVLNCRKSLPHPGDMTEATSKSRHVELTIIHPGRTADESGYDGRGIQLPHIVIDISEESEEEQKRLRASDVDSESERGEPKHTTRLDDGESFV
ncbi:hypothetical protein GSI_05556 [Ganoderma sinense ZZ0214-1]|uniref:DUF6534 domain-containing protein n=1 Tax=Ganoderma sinense ZZ0214-1 TaxID=1077348 RepID=A0A2G8SEX1_9APHY|nr:hypothetical protein GSI_05556 [Ganoderma sinense ZZ0214-1]